MKIVVALQQPDFKILKWSLKDTRNLSENAMRLGAPLAEGECLFKSLQCTYTVKVDREDPPIDEAEPKILRNAAKGETSRNAIAKSNRVTVANYSSLDTQESPLLFASKFCSSL